MLNSQVGVEVVAVGLEPLFLLAVEPLLDENIRVLHSLFLLNTVVVRVVFQKAGEAERAHSVSRTTKIALQSWSELLLAAVAGADLEAPVGEGVRLGSRPDRGG